MLSRLFASSPFLGVRVGVFTGRRAYTRWAELTRTRSVSFRHARLLSTFSYSSIRIARLSVSNVFTSCVSSS